MSVLNGERFLCESLESILEQSFNDLEFIIIDDGSSDSTWTILSGYARKDSRIVLLQNSTTIGLTLSLNRALTHSRGIFIARQDADDVSISTRLEQQLDAFDNTDNAVLVSCSLQIIDAEGRVVRHILLAESPELVAWHLLFHNYLNAHSQVMFRRESVAGIGGYAASYRYGQDYELWSRLSRVGTIVILPEVLMRYRYHRESISERYNAEQQELHLSIARENLSICLGERLNKEVVRDLRNFWTGNLFSSDRAGLIHSWLGKVFDSFVEGRLQNGNHSPWLSQTLRFQIAQRFVYFAREFMKKGQISQSIVPIAYAAAWHPFSLAGLVGGWRPDLITNKRSDRADYTHAES